MKSTKKEVLEIKQDNTFLWFISHERYFYFLLSLVSILFLISLFLLFQTTEEKTLNCADGTIHNSCSLIKPYYCVNGKLIEKASVCECPEGLIKDDDECLSQYHTNPKNITLRYILNGKENKINFTVYEGITNYLSEISRSIDSFNGEPTRADFKFKKLNEENQRNFLLPLVVEIKNLEKEKEEQMKIAVSIVQNIEWGYSSKIARFGGASVAYSRYPYEILYDSQGICGEKSELLAFLLRELGYEVVLFYNQEENHESVGVRCPLEYSWNNSGYCFIETSGPSIITDTSINYIGGLKLTSEPQIISISQGISLGNNLEEYEDSKKLMKIREEIDAKGKVSFFNKLRLYKFSKKYGLVSEYNLE